ncbi:MAG: hypothetical protein ABWX97_02805, partial [Domibacillus tundrae]
AERSIYDFVPARKARPKPNSDNEKAIKALIAKADSQIRAETKEKADRENEYDEFDAIDRILFREELMRDHKTYKGFYWDADIIEFIESVSDEYQSELMNEIVRSVLTRKGVL